MSLYRPDNEEGKTLEPIGGAIVGAGGALAKSGPFDKLLGPLAEFWGKRLLEDAQERHQRRLERRAYRATTQIVALLESPAKTEFEEKFEKITEDDAFEDWVEGVGNVDPEYVELTELWRAALLGVGDDGTRELIAILRKMSREDAKQFQKYLRLRGHTKPSFVIFSMDAYYIEIFRRIGLIIPISVAISLQWKIWSVFLIIIVICFITSNLPDSVLILGPRASVSIEARSIAQYLMYFSMLCEAMIFTLLIQIPLLTRAGMRLRKLHLKLQADL